MAEAILQSYNGLIRFYDGTIIAIEDQEYSPDGLYNWETLFNPYTHISSLDGVTTISGHRYKRVKHSGDTSFQLPYRIIAEEPQFRINDNILQYKLETETVLEWKDLLDMTTLQGNDGATGAQGIQGEGFHIDSYGYYQLRPDCSAGLVSACTTCNNSGSTTREYTFMSLGDGVLVLTSALISAGTVTVDGVPYTHFSNDLVTWTILSGGIVDFEARYLATNSSGAVYTDMRTEDYYGSRGVVYVCYDGSWTVLSNVATPSYMVGETSGSTNIGFLDNFVDASTNGIVGSIGIQDGLLEVIKETIDETAFAANTFGDGITHTVGNVPIINASDFAGFGLSTYTADSDSTENMQVLVDALLGDGLAVHTIIAVDGETPNIAKVNVNDLINNSSGLIATAQVDTFYDLSVKLGNGLQFNSDTPVGIEVDVDDLSLMVDATSLRVKPYASGNDGVMRQHINPDIIRANMGAAFDTATGLYVRIDNSTIGYDGSGNLQVPLNGITGDRLNDDTADNTKGIEVSNDMLAVKVDGTTISFDGSGQLYYKGAAGTYVSSITAGGTTVRNDVIYNVTSGDGSIDIGLTATVNVGSDTIDLTLAVDEAWLAAYLVSNPPAGTAAAWGSIATGTGVANQGDLVSYISALNHVVLDTWYGKGSVHTTNGLMVKATSGETYKIIVDANGNLDTVLVP